MRNIVFLALPFCLFLSCCSDLSSMGIHQTLNMQGTLVCDEAITINVDPSRSNEEITADFNTLLATRLINCGPVKADQDIPADLIIIPMPQIDTAICEE